MFHEKTLGKQGEQLWHRDEKPGPGEGAGFMGPVQATAH